MGYGSCEFLAGHAVRLGVLDMIRKRTVGNALRHKGRDGEKAAGLEVDALVVPILAEEHIVVEVRELGREAAKLVSACSLFDGHVVLQFLRFAVFFVMDWDNISFSSL